MLHLYIYIDLSIVAIVQYQREIQKTATIAPGGTPRRHVIDGDRRSSSSEITNVKLFHGFSLSPPFCPLSITLPSAMTSNSEMTDNYSSTDTAQWITDCPRSPLVKRQKMEGYVSGGSWHEGRVELKFNASLVDHQAKQTAKEVLLQAFMRLDQTIKGECLFHRPYTQSVDCVDPRQHPSPAPTECLGGDGDASCGRLGSVVPIFYGYTMYGRIDNIQVLVQDPAMFTQLMDELIDVKVSNLRQATVCLGALEMNRKEKTQNLQVQHERVLGKFAKYHQDKLVAWVCGQPFNRMVGDMLAAWELERQKKCQTWQLEYQQKSMNVEHEYHQKRREILRINVV